MGNYREGAFQQENVRKGLEDVGLCWGGFKEAGLCSGFDAVRKQRSFFPGGAGGKPPCQGRRHKRCGFDPWVGKIPWRRA